LTLKRLKLAGQINSTMMETLWLTVTHLLQGAASKIKAGFNQIQKMTLQGLHSSLVEGAFNALWR